MQQRAGRSEVAVATVMVAVAVWHIRIVDVCTAGVVENARDRGKWETLLLFASDRPSTEPAAV